MVAGFGNVLRSDDGFGPAVARYLEATSPPPAVLVLEIGIGGIHLVQELLDPASVLVIVDAVNLDRTPGTVVVLEPEVADLTGLSVMDRRDQLADMHYATPERALLLAGAMGVLPATTWLVGCEPVDADEPGIGLSPAVEQAVAVAAAEVRRLLADAGFSW